MWFFVLGGLLASAGTPVSSFCPVETQPQSAAVEILAPFSANCTTLSKQVEGMGWESSNGGTALTPGVSHTPINIESVTDWDLQPRCFINLHNGSQCFKKLDVIVYKMPDSVSMSISQEGPLVEGTPYRLLCDILNVAPVDILSVRWHKGSEVFYTETFNKSTVRPDSRSSSVRLLAKRDDNGTMIWCEAKLNFGPTRPDIIPTKSQPHEVIVLYPPTFANPEQEELELPADGTVVLNCSAPGNPVPVYSWNSSQMLSKTKDPTLPWTLAAEFPGTYSCTATNSQGTRTKYFKVIDHKRNHTTIGIIVGVGVVLGAIFCVVLCYFLRSDGSFSSSKGSYQPGQPASSGPV